MADQRKQNETPAADAFPTPEKIAAMPTARRVDNPAKPFVEAVVDQGPQKITVGNDMKVVNRRRQQIANAAKDLGFDAKTKLNKPHDGNLYFTVTRPKGTSPATETAS